MNNLKFSKKSLSDYDKWEDPLKEVSEQIAKLTAAKQNAYWERDQLVLALSKIWPSHITLHPDEDKDWENDWRHIICIHSPVGQLTWHIHDSEVGWFKHLLTEKNDWDGHSTEEKYQRLLNLK